MRQFSPPISRPIGERDGERALVVYRGRARALRTESADTVAEEWGVSVASGCEKRVCVRHDAA